jgi:hypothetical protein
MSFLSEHMSSSNSSYGAMMLFSRPNDDFHLGLVPIKVRVIHNMHQWLSPNAAPRIKETINSKNCIQLLIITFFLYGLMQKNYVYEKSK